MLVIGEYAARMVSIGGRAAAVFVFVRVLCLVCTVHALRTLTTGLTYKIKLSLCKKRVFWERIYTIPFVLANDNRKPYSIV